MTSPKSWSLVSKLNLRRGDDFWIFFSVYSAFRRPRPSICRLDVEESIRMLFCYLDTHPSTPPPSKCVRYRGGLLVLSTCIYSPNSPSDPIRCCQTGQIQQCPIGQRADGVMVLSKHRPSGSGRVHICILMCHVSLVLIHSF